MIRSIIRFFIAGIVLLVVPAWSGVAAAHEEGAKSKPAAQITDAERLVALEECPAREPACMGMEMNLIWKKELPEGSIRDTTTHPIVVSWEPFGIKDYSNFRLAVTGRLNGGAPKKYTLSIQRFVGGLDCFDFWVAMIGFSADGSGIILTDKGTLALVETPLRVGCDDCIALIDKKTLAVSYTVSPVWYLQLQWGDPIFHPNGAIYWKVKKTCIKVVPNARTQKIDSKLCMAKKPVQASDEVVNRVQAAKIFGNDHMNKRIQYDLHELKSASFYIFIYRVACT